MVELMVCNGAGLANGWVKGLVRCPVICQVRSLTQDCYKSFNKRMGDIIFENWMREWVTSDEQIV